MDNISKALTFLFIAIGSGIFLMIVSIKMDVITQKTQVQVQDTITQTDWEGRLHRQAIAQVMRNKDSEKK